MEVREQRTQSRQQIINVLQGTDASLSEKRDVHLIDPTNYYWFLKPRSLLEKTDGHALGLISALAPTVTIEALLLIS